MKIYPVFYYTLSRETEKIPLKLSLSSTLDAHVIFVTVGRISIAPVNL